jgi:arylsulfatase
MLPLLLGLLAGSAEATGAAVDKPNVILVMSDDMSWGELGMTGNTIIKTPALDAFAAEALRFSNFHVAPSCAPTRAQIMSGRHEFSVGVTHTVVGRMNLRDDITILPQYMKQGGYQTAMFGKWHLSDGKTGLTGKPLEPHERGFDHALWTFNQLKRFDPPLNLNGDKRDYNGYCADVLFDEAMKWMDAADATEPFFAYIATSIPHAPVAAPQKYMDFYKDAQLTGEQKGYYAMVSALDANMGRLLKWLNGRPFADNTVVVFMTDNGHAISGAEGAGHDADGFLKKGGLFNAGMRGAKGQAWLGTTCVPFFIRWPGVTTAGTNNTFASATDLLPTFAAVAGVNPDDPDITGYNLLPDIRGQASTVPDNRLLVSHRGRWPRSDELEACKYNYVSVYDKRFRLTWGQADEGPQLIDYIDDPGGNTDVSSQHPEMVALFTKYFDRWWEEVKPGMVNDLNQIRTGNIRVAGDRSSKGEKAE